MRRSARGCVVAAAITALLLPAVAGAQSAPPPLVTPPEAPPGLADPLPTPAPGAGEQPPAEVAPVPGPALRVRSVTVRKRSVSVRLDCRADGSLVLRSHAAHRTRRSRGRFACSDEHATSKLHLTARNARFAHRRDVKSTLNATSGTERTSVDVAVGEPRAGARSAQAELIGARQFSSECANDWNGTFSFPFLQAIQLEASPWPTRRSSRAQPARTRAANGSTTSA